MIKLYGSKMTSAFRCHILLEEMGIEFEEVPVDFSKAEHKSADFLKLNPNGKVPCLIDGKLVLWESMAINRYLAGKYKPELLGNTLEQSAKIDQWSYWVILYVQNHLFTLLMNKDEDVIRQAKEALIPYHQILDDHLARNDYMIGLDFTLADINMGSVILINLLVKNNLSPFPNIGNWLKKMVARPAFQ